MSTLQQKITACPPDALAGIRRGIEKEGLRVLPTGDLALTPHPAALGSALTHPHITTDYSESQIELVTGAHRGVQQCLDELTEIHQFALRTLHEQGDEMLWVSSMPCRLPTDETIPLARYGSSNVGRAKSVYRMGLGHRYGRRMQTICGIHYNWSMPGVTSEQYFALIRNFRRNAFVLLYLFGASPALCPCFAQGRPHALQRLSDQALYLPHATSLRMGRLGYQSDAQATLAVSYNGLDGYADSLHEALPQPYPAYEAVGITAETMRLLDVFLLHCLLSDSPPDTPQEITELKRNQHLTAERGREPGLCLVRNGQNVALVDWAAQVLQECAPLAAALDASHHSTDYSAALASARATLAHPVQTPSARVLEQMAREHGNNFTSFSTHQSAQARDALLDLPWSDAQHARFTAMAEESVAAQKAIEAADALPFEEWRQHYMAAQGVG